jgi:hypothetical protein
MTEQDLQRILFGNPDIKVHEPVIRVHETIIRKSAPSTRDEHQEQAALFGWAKAHEHEWGGALKVLHAIPNGGYRGVQSGFKLKQEGVKRGFPDIGLPVARKGVHGLYIELKRTKGGKVSPEQHEWHHWLTDNGYLVAVCHGADAAIEVIKEYLS